jgi:hypothetical protein
VDDQSNAASPDKPSARVVEQRLRNRVMESLELAASFEEQSRYELAAPIVHVPYEVINGFEDGVISDPRTDPKVFSVYTVDEVAALGKYYDAWNVVADALSDDFPPLAEVQSLPEWSDLREVAQATLAVFNRRGRLSEDREVE